MNVTFLAPTKQDLLDNLNSLHASCAAGVATRDYYRHNSGYPDRHWQKYWPTWSQFVNDSIPVSGDQPTAAAETSEVIGDRWNVTLPKTHIRTLEELKKHSGIDESIWEIVSHKISAWQGAGAGEDSLFSVRASMVKRNQIIAIRDEIESLKNEAKLYARAPLPIIDSGRLSGNSLELLIPDLHAGKLAWHRETGGADYDTRIAEETYRRVLATLLKRARGFQFDEIMLGVGNDLLHSDNFNSQTTKGTQVDSDTRYPKTYTTVRKMLVDTIEELRLIAPVKVKMIPGNHDTLTNFTLGDSLECWFHNYTDVDIDNDPIPHKTYSWGDVFLVLTHGDKGKQADYGLWMATQWPKEFGNSKFREVHIGHTHKSKVDEKYGVRVRTFSALCPPDAWHSEEHFVGNLRSAEAIVWNKTAGRIAEFIHTEVD